MSGLRQRQKEQRREAIVGAALELFEAQGFSSTTVEQIAVQAGVSTPTVFNYFGSKQDILLAMMERADQRAVSDARLQMPAFDNAVDAMCHLESQIIRQELEALPVAIWRELLPLGLLTQRPDAAAQLNSRLVQQVGDLLRELQARGLLRADFDVDFVADFLNDYSSVLFMRLVQDEVPDLVAHERRIRQLTQTLFDGLAP
ncbi:TetR/AcrR family transcriptional regulator [Pseudomonas aeruginosa]|uniref:TetR/AcrR family transcriptional regulator n=1 Tax=Pseudomonas aeruginosa TaxID=287 RepID=UPI00053CF255|nr:TetR/AcrR family transcriptional regulator [Pseudomonas aeruginosa]MCO2031486.1 TetR/AcrR family transcriptional regulator [Pseudomonas aeruginosa]MCS7675729.1 TetR/AcrR family transcriptional regulator [Pseudomonas aeruginosa]MCS7905036.1 TetR/AcrR family transcriptional regulator [Pseudomonas aeruginosa]MCS9345799.1 TetR/AcrR family transcriptional regulator [Pseudomonas aeruginosa]MCS9358638.1 TetR/AcrR family transcriptional regulator [Pseudomonas aeruginosa]